MITDIFLIHLLINCLIFCLLYFLYISSSPLVWKNGQHSWEIRNVFSWFAKQLKVYHKYTKWTCNTQCHSLEMVSIYREDKIQLIKDGLSKESLDNFLLTLETHPSEDVHCVIHYLWPYFHKKKNSFRNLTKKTLFFSF